MGEDMAPIVTDARARGPPRALPLIRGLVGRGESGTLSDMSTTTAARAAAATTAAASLDPSAILQTAFGFWSSKVLLTAVEMGLFTALGDGRRLTAAALGRELGLHP